MSHPVTLLVCDCFIFDEKRKLVKRKAVRLFAYHSLDVSSDSSVDQFRSDFCFEYSDIFDGQWVPFVHCAKDISVKLREQSEVLLKIQVVEAR